jgi:membrane-associated protease RseP (regulator of RpoE activity)
MNSRSNPWPKSNSWWLPLAGILTTGQLLPAPAAELSPRAASVATVRSASGSGGGGSKAGSSQSEIILKTFENPAETGDNPLARSDRPWLGVGIEEASEALASQLDLAPGVGLLVTYVAPDSPAAKAGLQKNDVLTELDGQALAHPLQLRKLVQVRKEGSSVEIVFYRSGKKQTVSTTLAKTPAGFGLLEDGNASPGTIFSVPHPPRLPPMANADRGQFKLYLDSLGHLKLDQQKVQEEVRRSVEQARKAWEKATQNATNAASSAVAKALRELERYRANSVPDNSASVTVRSTGERVKSIVKTDDAGTIVIVSNPKPRLTAHDKDGKLLFDGEIDTPAQRAKVPADLWRKVEPLLDTVAPKAED